MHLLPLRLHPQIKAHTDGIPLPGTAIGSADYISAFLQNKLQQASFLLKKVDKIQSLQSRYQIVKLSISTKLRHLLWSLSSSRLLLAQFYLLFD